MKRFFLSFLLILASAATWAASTDSLRVCGDLPKPTISSQKAVSCAGQPVILQAEGCLGMVVWSNQKKGINLTVYPAKTTTYTAYCQKDSCRSENAKPYTVEITTPRTPIVNANNKKICYGQSTVLTVSGCPQEAIWSDGSTGNEITVSPRATTKYTATCRVDGCISCFAEDIIITVLAAPLSIRASQSTVCAGESVTLSAGGNCGGQIKWNDGVTSQEIIVKPTATTTYSVVCESEGCATILNQTTVQVAVPSPPALAAIRSNICRGESATLLASNCTGTVKWSNGATGASIVVKPETSTAYSAFCERGNCQSINSSVLLITVAGEIPAQPNVLASVSNKCPFVTVDLSGAIQTKPAGIVFEARTGASVASPLVENVGAVSVGETYYIFAKNDLGCVSAPAVVKTIITPCRDGVPLCINNPAQVVIIKAERAANGNYFLEGKWSGSATSATWSSNGTGVFSNIKGINSVYTTSEADQKAGEITLAFTTNDPDSTGSCAAAIATTKIKTEVIVRSKEIVGLSKNMNSFRLLANKKYLIEYWLRLVNLGQNDLSEVSLVDSLDKTFKNGAVIVGKPKVKVISSDMDSTELIGRADTTFTGQGGNYNLLVPELNEVAKGKMLLVSLTVEIDATNSQDSVVYNTAYVTALDINGNICRDISTDGKVADSNQNGDASDDSSPTPVVLSSAGKDGDLFVPEGFSPNGDGINDALVIQKPATLKVSLEIFNRWGGAVYRNDDYKNDWSGGPIGAKTNDNLPVGTYFSVVKTSDGREFSKFLTITR